MSSSGRSSYTPSFSWSSPSSSFPSSVSFSPSSSLPSSPSSVWRCSSSSRSPQRSPQRPMNNLLGRRGRTPISGRGHQTIPLHHRTPSYSPPRRSRMYSNHRRHYSRSPSYSSDLSRRRSYSPHYSRRRASPSYNRRRAISLLQSAAQNILCSVQSV
ncbi:arginine/serine-rich protein 1-like [Prunus dulcis]|uniref:arginine/serine-rich protein 1-like n=1 Tax=Prunus dulcis TaxID=3755 RepID=UPI001482D82B|nr:arginine/serine-rich protein 1-like [Prunus dulcis]